MALRISREGILTEAQGHREVRGRTAGAVERKVKCMPLACQWEFRGSDPLRDQPQKTFWQDGISQVVFDSWREPIAVQSRRIVLPKWCSRLGHRWLVSSCASTDTPVPRSG